MNVLFIHSDKLSYEAKKKTKFAEEAKGKEKASIGESLVAFLAFEESDNHKEEEIAGRLVKEVEEIAGQVKEKTVVLYPYVHLLFGKKPSSPSTALKIIDLAEEKLGERGFKVHRSPFGYYKAFEVACKGHPLSELSRVIESGKGGGDESKALKAEETLKSYWNIMDEKGNLHPLTIKGGKVRGFDFSKWPELEKFANYEMAKSRKVDQEPPHVKLMKQLGLADYEPGSDPGNLRYPPKGKLVKALMEQFVTEEVHRYGAMEIESPIMYDFEHPSLKKYLDRFPARQYTIVTPNKKVFLRFSACFGQFLMLHDATLSYRQLPMKLYELTKYSFRVEKRGELTGLRRLRAFTMPDCHAFCADMDQAKKEFLERFELVKRTVNGLGLNEKKDLELAVRIVKPFWEKNKEYIKGFVKNYGKPALIEMWDKQFFYFTLKYELNFVDALEKASALSTDQIDIENGERYDLKFVGKDNKARNPLILHCSPSGAIERVVYALLERAYMQEKKGKPPSLPLWLSPTMVRLCPVSEKFVGDCEKIAESMGEKRIRVDVDDRNETVSKKVRDAELEWVPYTIVLGEKELKSGKLAVRERATGKVREMKEEDLAREIGKQTEGKPYRLLPLPRLLTKRPVFIS